MISILMNIESAEYVRDINLKDEAVEASIKFSCETPLNEMDACAMFALYFGEIYYEVSDESYFTRKGSCQKWGEYEVSGF